MTGEEVMKFKLTEDRPIYVQIKDYIEESIINETMHTGERIPSTNEFAQFYKINPATAAKGVNELVAEGIIEKKRGVGMFVTDIARGKLIEKRKEDFFKEYIQPLKEEAKRLGISITHIQDMIDKEEGQ